jgi:hypothetical protein
MVCEALINVEKRAKWDSVVIDFHIVDEDIENNLTYIYYKVKTPIGIGARDFL